MIEIEESDYDSLSGFPLKWRWTDSQWNLLPDEALQQIHPLSKSKTIEIYQYSSKFRRQIGPDETAKFKDSAGDITGVLHWLQDCSLGWSGQVVVSWDNFCAVYVSWEIFCQYWDDFCYPSSDDAVIWPLTEEWFLIFDHKEKFFFHSNTI